MVYKKYTIRNVDFFVNIKIGKNMSIIECRRKNNVSIEIAVKLCNMSENSFLRAITRI